MRHKPRRLTAALLVFPLFFQLLAFPALANGGRRNLIRASEPAAAGALRASLKTDISSPQFEPRWRPRPRPTSPHRRTWAS